MNEILFIYQVNRTIGQITVGELITSEEKGECDAGGK